MRVEGDDAKLYNAVSLHTFLNVNEGELLMADDITGDVRWKDRTGETRSKTLGSHAIRILRK